MARRQKRPRQKRFFVGCEGESERGYTTFLQILAKDIGLAIHLDAHPLGNAGDPLELVIQAVSAIAKGEKGGKPAYKDRFLILDTDRFGQDQNKDTMMFKIAKESKLNLVKQECCIEAVLLRHINGKEANNPPTTTAALQQLKKAWPDYNKATSAQDLAKKFTLEDVRRAAAQPIQSDLNTFLLIIGLLDK